MGSCSKCNTKLSTNSVQMPMASSLIYSQVCFSQSVKFSSSNSYSTTFFTFSSWFSLSSRFVRSRNFSLSSNFTKSNTFKLTNVFTPADSKYVYFMRMSSQAWLPPQASQYGPLSTMAMETVSTSVIIIIIVVGSILMAMATEEEQWSSQSFLNYSISIPTHQTRQMTVSYLFHTLFKQDNPSKMHPNTT